MATEFGYGRDAVHYPGDKGCPEHPRRVAPPTLRGAGLQGPQQGLGVQGIQHRQEAVAVIEAEELIER